MSYGQSDKDPRVVLGLSQKSAPTMMSRRRCTAALIVLAVIMSVCAAFQVALPSMTRSVQKPLFMFSAEDDQVVPTTTKAQPTETEMKPTTETVTPKLESKSFSIEKQSGGIDIS